MKLKYYLRGLGIGIIVTLLLTGIAGNKKQEMTDAEIKARAAELGMIESTTLSEPEGIEGNEENDQAQAEEVTQMPQPTQVEDEDATDLPNEDTLTDIPTPTQIPEADVTETPEPTEEPDETPVNTPTETPGMTDEIVTITVNSGDSSEAVSRKAEEAGLVQDAWDFDQYLCENGYDKRITTGEHRIPMSATYEEIARILTGR